MILVCNNREGAVSVLDNLPKQYDSQASKLYHSGRQYSLTELQAVERWKNSHRQLVDLHERWQEHR